MSTETLVATAAAGTTASAGGTVTLMYELAASFAGAAAAFVFFLFGQALLKAYERRKSHYNAMVALERLLNLQLDQANLIRNQTPEMRGPVSQGQVLVALPRPILETDGLFLELLDLELTNLLIDHRVSTNRLNSDICNIRDAYQSLKDQYLAGSLDQNTYLTSSMFLIGKYGELADALGNFDSQVMDVLARIRLRLRERRPLSFRVLDMMSSVNTKPLEEAAIVAERKNLAAECAEAANPLKPE